ncbi:MAG: hypothetical protein VKJ06_07430 [Vampirovibrionales bacterium]|nr:hypothetical protein [Vampirovibrionales bacterium]
MGIWDGAWTDAQSGVEGELYDPGRTDGESGLKPDDAPKSFHIPPPRRWDQVDLDEPSDYKGEAYTPYARLRLMQPLQAQTMGGRVLRLSPGYYLVKAAALYPGNIDPNGVLIQSVPIGQQLQPDTGLNPGANTDLVYVSGQSGATIAGHGLIEQPMTLPSLAQPVSPQIVSPPSPVLAPAFSGGTRAPVATLQTAVPAQQSAAASGENTNTTTQPQDPKAALPRYLLIKQTGKVLAIIPLSQVARNTHPKKMRPRHPQISVQTYVAASGEGVQGMPANQGRLSTVLQYEDRDWLASAQF